MFPLWNFFLRKNRFTFLLVAFLAIVGLISVITIPKESNPEIKVPIGVVTTVLPGASPADIEKLITNEIEDGLSNLENVDKITSSSKESVSSIVVEFDASADLDESIDKLKEEVDKVKRELPDEAEEPSVIQVDFANEPILVVTLSSDLPEMQFRRVVEDAKDEVKSVSGVSDVTIRGIPEREAQVIVDQRKLESFGLNLSEVTSVVRSSNAALPIGSIEIDGVNYAIQFEGDLNDPAELYDVAIPRDSGSPVYLRDIAFIADGSEDRSFITRTSIDGSPSEQSVTLSITKRAGGNILQISDTVKETINELRGDTLADVSVLYSFDVSELIRDDLNNLTRSGIQTVILVIILLLIFVGPREALIAGLAIPFSFLISFIGLSISGNTINFVSLFSLILAIGILVDSAIVITEAMHTKIRKGINNIEAARQTLHSYAWPLITGTLTTVAVFAPLFFISGITGQFIKSIPFTIIFVLLASLFVALGITPLISATFLTANEESARSSWSEKLASRMQTRYELFLKKFIGIRKRENRFITLVIVLMIIAFMLPVTGLLKVTFFPPGDVDFIYIEIEKPFGTTLAQTDLAVREVEEYLYEETDIESFVSTVGASSNFGNNPDNGEHLANININLIEERTLTSTQFTDKLSDKLQVIKGTEVRVLQVNNGPPVGAPLSIKLLGEDLDDLEVAAKDVEELLNSVEGTSDISSSVKDNGIEYSFEINRAKAASFGITPIQVASTLRTAIEGTESTSIRQGDTEIDVIVKLALNDAYRTPEETAQTTADRIRNITIQTPNGAVLLDSFTDVSVAAGSANIRHEDKERIVTVNSFLKDGAILSDVTDRFFEKVEDNLELPEGVRLEIGGENEEVDQSFKEMGYALVAGLFLIASILIIQFNSIRYTIFISIVPLLSLAGILFGLTLTGQTLSFPSLMGFITLAGIVVNNAIILIDAANTYREEGKEIVDAAIAAAVARLRPIILTTITTVAGMVPLIIVSELWGPLAIAVIFGLIYSLILTLMLIPLLYSRFGQGCGYSKGRISRLLKWIVELFIRVALKRS